MNHLRTLIIVVSASLVLYIVSPVWSQISIQIGPREREQRVVEPYTDVEPLTRGPLHEAFAEPVVLNGEAVDFVTTTPPPAPIDEVPPDQQPSGENVQWIPGYWFWEPSMNNFVWVSGCWREAPPDARG